MAYRDEIELRTIRETLSLLNVDSLKDLLALVGRGIPTRKAELVERLASVLENPTQVRALYQELDDLAKNALKEAAHDPQGVWHKSRFAAKYGGLPPVSVSGPRSYSSKPTHLRLFFPHKLVLPTDLRTTLLEFVPVPPRLTIDTLDELPARVRRPQVHLGGYHSPPNQEEIELRVRPTAPAALLDVKAVLRLIDAGQVKVGEKTRVPSRASVEAVAAVLSEGDFYTAEDASKHTWDPSSDLVMQAFAWPLLLQAATLVGAGGTKLQLTPAGRQAITRPAHEVIRQIWGKWLKTTLLDEFNRIDVIKGQQSRGSLAAVPPRREAIAEQLKGCPPGKWIRLESLFRMLKASEKPLVVSRNEEKLYINSQHYGTLGYGSSHGWEQVEGRYTMVLLFEYAATLGLVDVAYISPERARNDFRDRWGTDDYACLSRYDGLMYFRVNPFGAWCLGLADTYVPSVVEADKVLRVLPNFDVVAADRPPSVADVLFLDRFTERRSESVWHLSKDQILDAVEKGQAVGELRDFLTSRSQDALPQTVVVFLTDIEEKAGLLEDRGAARLIACKDAVVAQTLAADRRLRGLCQLAGERHLVYRVADEAAVRKALKGLGYVLPPPG